MSFQEYLAAAEIARTRNEKLLYEKIKEDRWKAAIIYYAGLARNPSKLIRKILSQKDIALASECLNEARRIEKLFAEELAILKRKVRAKRYENLVRLLKLEKWEKADRETVNIMLEIAGQVERGYLVPGDLKDFPCEEIKTIDHLWLKASKGYFGFSVQREIWKECGRPMVIGEKWNRFCAELGWKHYEAQHYSDFSHLHKTYDYQLCKGQLPLEILTASKFSVGRHKAFLSIVEKIESCQKYR